MKESKEIDLEKYQKNIMEILHNIEKELVNMKETKKHKNHIKPEKYKNYSQEISQLSYTNLNKYTDIYNVIVSSRNKPNTKWNSRRKFKKFGKVYIRTIIEEEYEGYDEKKNKMTNTQLDEMISRIEKWDINKYENEDEEDIEMNYYSQNKANKNSIKRNSKKDVNRSSITENLNEKNNFRMGEINYTDIVFNKDKKKLRFNKMTYFKSPGDYNAIRYFSCGNYNKKSKKDQLNKICEGKIK